NVMDHHERSDSKTYIAARKLMVELAKQAGGTEYGPNPWQDHHSGVLWVHDGSTWRMFQNLAGLEWSAQFCADPSKVEVLRQNAEALYKAFPETEARFKAMGYQNMVDILHRPIASADDVANWTDSIFNASMPLPQAVHTGTIHGKPDGAKPIAGI